MAAGYKDLISTHRIKDLTARVADRTGYLDRIMRKKLNGRAFVLMYHRVVTAKESMDVPVQPGMYVSRETFERHLVFLSRSFKVVHLSELLELLLMGRNLSGYCAITFDDGWLDNYVHAYPLLERYHVPACIFLATGFIGSNRMFWPDMVATYLYAARTKADMTRRAKDLVGDIRLERGLRETNLCETISDRAIEFIKKLSEEERCAILEKVEQNIFGNNRIRFCFNWEEAKEMYESGLVSFGAHTVNHVLLDHADMQRVQREIEESKASIRENLGVETTLFSYPNGNYSQSIIDILRNNGFTGAVTTKKGYLGTDTSPYETPRISIHNDVSADISRFKARIAVSHF